MKCNVKNGNTVTPTMIPWAVLRHDKEDAFKGYSICCICGEIYPSMQSNNPFPVRPQTYEVGDTMTRCCKDCNDFFVLRSRAILRKMTTQEEYDKCVKWMHSMSLNELDRRISMSTKDAVAYFYKKIMKEN